MKIVSVVFFILISVSVPAQHNRSNPAQEVSKGSGKFISFNPLGLAEPQMAVGMGFGTRFTKRSGCFTELSYVSHTPFYDYENVVNGFRFLAQYRYFFLQQVKPLIDLGFNGKERRAKHHPFIAVEFRLKKYKFSGENSFENLQVPDTISRYRYDASARSVGGALIVGSTYNISRNGKWKFEMTAGIGGKQKFVKYKNLPAGYHLVKQRRADSLGPPDIDEAVGTPYFPFAARLQFRIGQ